MAYSNVKSFFRPVVKNAFIVKYNVPAHMFYLQTSFGQKNNLILLTEA